MSLLFSQLLFVKVFSVTCVYIGEVGTLIHSLAPYLQQALTHHNILDAQHHETMQPHILSAPMEST